MFSGCRDDETSADAQINGVTEGKLNTSFHKNLYLTNSCHELGVSRVHKDQPGSDLQGGEFWLALHMTRALLKASEYTQVTLSSLWF
ncbi:hypothetical protein E4T48_07235 [Aureobasidium sp. EXF-10727]|nr:hypothetical protein E4T48_07235 [Aureobasidium sp. EXF-10727]